MPRPTATSSRCLSHPVTAGSSSCHTGLNAPTHWPFLQPFFSTSASSPTGRYRRAHRRRAQIARTATPEAMRGEFPGRGRYRLGSMEAISVQGEPYLRHRTGTVSNLNSSLPHYSARDSRRHPLSPYLQGIARLPPLRPGYRVAPSLPHCEAAARKTGTAEEQAPASGVFLWLPVFAPEAPAGRKIRGWRPQLSDLIAGAFSFKCRRA